MDFIKKSLYVFKNKYFGLAIEFINSILIVRYLGPESYGYYAVLFILPNLVSSLGSFGYGPSIVYHINKLEFNLSRYLGTFTFLGLTLGIIYIFIILFFLEYINKIFYENNLDTSMFFISLLFIPIMITQKYIRAIIRGMYNIKLFSNLLDLSIPILRFVFIATFIFINLGLLGMVFIPVIVQGIITLYIFLYLFKKSNFNTSNLFINKVQFLLITKFALKNYLGTALQKSNESLIMLIASALLSFKEVGLLSLATKLLQLIASISNSTLTVLMPKVSKSKIEDLKSNIPRVTSILFTFNIIAITIYLLFLEFFIKLTYGIEFIGIVKFSVPLATVTIFLPFANILLTTITHTGDPIKKMYARGLGFIVNLIFVYPLFLNYGAIGFVISIALGQFIIFLAALFFYKNKFKENNLNKLFLIKINDVKYLLKTIKKQVVI